MELEKPYYTITELAAMLNVNASLLRYWETEFPQIKPYKNKKGDRRYTHKDIALIQTIYTLTKVDGYTIQGAREVLKKKAHPESIAHVAVEEVVERLEALKTRLLNLCPDDEVRL